MTRYRHAFTLLLTFAAFAAHADGPGLSLRITDEAAPAGSIVQLKVEVTEPKPISTGHGKIRGLALVRGIVLMNKDQDTYGLAMLDGDTLSFNVVSPSSLFGTPGDYPILGIAAEVPASGATVTIDPAGLGFRDPSGAVYPYEIKNGSIRVANGITIGDVTPGSSVVPAGGVVTITGTNFMPDTRLQLSEVAIREQRFISSNRIDVVVAQAVNMHGLRIRARNDNPRSECEYFSYERTYATGTSNDAVLKNVVPLFAPASYLNATVDLPRTTSSSRGRQRAVRRGNIRNATAQTLGVALQNLHGTNSASVVLELLDARGNVYAVNTVTVGPDRYYVRALSEIFGLVAPPSALRVRSDHHIQLLGLTADPSTGSAAALPPR